jgi:hypothetical protein
MSKTLLILLTLALVWLAAWGIAGYFFTQGAVDKLAQADYVSRPATRIEPGADVRVEGTVADGPSTEAPYSRRRCLAAVTDIAAVSSYRDSTNKTMRESQHIATRRVGPANIEIAVAGQLLQLPLERWTPWHETVTEVDDLPPRLGVAADEIEKAKGRARGQFMGYSVAETTINSGTRVFVVGQLEDGGDGKLRLGVDRTLGRLELYQGTQKELVEELRGSATGLRIAGWIVGAGVGPLPLAVIGLVLLARSRKRPKP